MPAMGVAHRRCVREIWRSIGGLMRHISVVNFVIGVTIVGLGATLGCAADPLPGELGGACPCDEDLGVLYCNDDDVCSLDRCDEARDMCIHAPRDLDLDGDPDWFCEGGGDCNDTDPLVNSLISEICAEEGGI